MRLHRIRLRSYRGVVDREVVFPATGITVVQGDNEVGKSSIPEALDLLLDCLDDSTRAAVRAVAPVGVDAGPEVEAELSAGPYRFTYTKRWKRDRRTELLVTAPRREQLTGREAHERVRAILAETVDEGLWRALRLQQGTGLDQPSLGGARALLEALDAATAGGLGGDDEHTLYARIAAERDRYLTPTGRHRPPLADAIRAHEDAVAERAAVQREVAQLEADVQRCGDLARRLADLRGQVAGLRERAAATDERWRALEQRAAAVERLRAEAELAAARVVGPREAVAARAALVADVTERRRERDAARSALAGASPAAAAAQEELAAAEAAAAGAQAAAEAAALRSRLAAEDLEHHRDRMALQLLGDRHRAVLAAQERLADAARFLETCRVDAATVARLEEAHLALVSAQARCEADSPVVALEALAEAGAELLVDGRAVRLGPGDVVEHPVDDEVEVAVPGVVRLRLRAGASARALAEERAAAEAALRSACAAAGVADLAAARALLRRRTEEEERRAAAERTLAENLRDLTPDLMQDKLGRLAARVEAPRGERPADHPLPADLDAARVAAERAAEEEALARAAVAEADRRVRAARERCESGRQHAHAARVAAEGADHALAAAAASLERARAQRPDEALAEAAGEAALAAAVAADAHRQALAQLEAVDPDGTRVLRDTAREAVDRAERELRRLEDEHLAVRQRLEVLGEQGLGDRLAEAERRVAHTAAARQAVEARAAAADRLFGVFTRHRDAARQAYVAPFRERLERLGRLVFGPDLQVELDDDLRIVRRTLGGVTLDYDQLSAGAREQLAVLARLACAAIVSRDGGVPVILDDALGFSDPGRLEGLGAAFAVAAREAQVIVLTCDPDRYRHVGAATVVELGGDCGPSVSPPAPTGIGVP